MRASALAASSDFVFTIVRQPIATAVSAFCEIDQGSGAHQGPGMWPPDRPRFRNMSCDDATGRYKAFLEDVGTPMNKLFFHAYPQAVKVDARPAGDRGYDAIVKIESLLDGLSEIAALTGCLLYTSPSPRDGLLSRMPSSA